jgi:NADPH-dependent 2,4-dienoyl-CoA reductase/sulfur reductase-like enzyme
MAQAWRSRDILKKGLRMLADLHAARINWITRVTDVRIDGDEHVYALTYRRGTEEVRLETDLVLLHQGVVPNIQLSRAIGCEHVWSEPQLCWVPKTDTWGQTTMDGVLIAGDGSGIDGAAAAEQAGRLAALQVACVLGRIDESTRDRAAVPLRKALMHQWRARPFLNALYRPEDRFRVPAREDVIACRCEDVSVGAVRAAARLGCAGPNQLKTFTRAGMGPCQGRMCGLTVYETLARARGVSPAAIGSYRLRPPIKPISLGAIAAMRVPGEDPDLDFNEALEVQNPEVSQFGDVPKWS